MSQKDRMILDCMVITAAKKDPTLVLRTVDQKSLHLANSFAHGDHNDSL